MVEILRSTAMLNFIFFVSRSNICQYFDKKKPEFPYEKIKRTIWSTCFRWFFTTRVFENPVAGKSWLRGRFPFDQIFRFEISGIPCDEWNSIFRFVGLPENVCSIRSPHPEFQEWSNGKRPWKYWWNQTDNEILVVFANIFPQLPWEIGKGL